MVFLLLIAAPAFAVDAHPSFLKQPLVFLESIPRKNSLFGGQFSITLRNVILHKVIKND